MSWPCNTLQELEKNFSFQEMRKVKRRVEEEWDQYVVKLIACLRGIATDELEGALALMMPVLESGLELSQTVVEVLGKEAKVCQEERSQDESLSVGPQVDVVELQK